MIVIFDFNNTLKKSKNIPSKQHTYQIIIIKGILRSNFVQSVLITTKKRKEDNEELINDSQNEF